MEQKLRDTNDVLSSKLKVIELLQTEISEKEKQILEQGTIIRKTTERLQITSEQLRMTQVNFSSMESQWKEQNVQLSDQIQKNEEKYLSETDEKSLTIQKLQGSVAEYEAMYNQVSAQLEKQGTVSVDVQRSSDETSRQEISEEIHVVKLKEELSSKEKEISQLKKKLEVSESSPGSPKKEKPDAKYMKYKAQATAKIKALEKQIEELKKVRKKVIFTFTINFSNVSNTVFLCRR